MNGAARDTSARAATAMTELECDLLAALKVMLHRTGHWFDESSGDLQQVRAAIARAEGHTHA